MTKTAYSEISILGAVGRLGAGHDPAGKGYKPGPRHESTWGTYTHPFQVPPQRSETEPASPPRSPQTGRMEPVTGGQGLNTTPAIKSCATLWKISSEPSFPICQRGQGPPCLERAWGGFAETSHVDWQRARHTEVLHK